MLDNGREEKERKVSGSHWENCARNTHEGGTETHAPGPSTPGAGFPGQVNWIGTGGMAGQAAAVTGTSPNGQRSYSRYRGQQPLGLHSTPAVRCGSSVPCGPLPCRPTPQWLCLKISLIPAATTSIHADGMPTTALLSPEQCRARRAQRGPSTASAICFSSSSSSRLRFSRCRLTSSTGRPCRGQVPRGWQALAGVGRASGLQGTGKSLPFQQATCGLLPALGPCAPG